MGVVYIFIHTHIKHNKINILKTFKWWIHIYLLEESYNKFKITFLEIMINLFCYIKIKSTALLIRKHLSDIWYDVTLPNTLLHLSLIAVYPFCLVTSLSCLYDHQSRTTVILLCQGDIAYISAVHADHD